MAAGLPTEGPNAAKPRAGQVVRTDVPTCASTDRIEEVRDRLKQSGWEACVAINHERVVMGLVRGDALAAPAGTPVEEAMDAGPATVRADEDLVALVTRLRKEDVAGIVVTTPEGRLIGMLCREDAERRLADVGG